MVMKVTKVFVAILLLLFTACEDAIDVSDQTADMNLIVVDGILTNENINHRITLTHTYRAQNQDASPVTGATVKVFEADNAVQLIEFPKGSGDYYTPKVRAVTGKVYTLQIIYQGKEYLAHDSSVPVEPLRDIRFQKTDNQFSIVAQKSGDNANFITYDLDWEQTPSCNGFRACKGRMVNYDLKTIDVNEFFKPAAEEYDFPENTIVIRKKYSVSEAYKTFLRAMLSETEWRGGVFDVQRENVVTNLSNGAVGFFAVSTVVSDTTIAK
jgi:hypothetical protein